jgi:hypothetical protein
VISRKEVLSSYKCENRKVGRLHVLGVSIDESSLGGECCDACESYVHDPRRQQYSLRIVSLRLRSGEDGLVYVIKAEAATACAKSDAKNDQKRSEGHPSDGEEREPVPTLNMVTVF